MSALRQGEMYIAVNREIGAHEETRSRHVRTTGDTLLAIEDYPTWTDAREDGWEIWVVNSNNQLTPDFIGR